MSKSSFQLMRVVAVLTLATLACATLAPAPFVPATPRPATAPPAPTRLPTVPPSGTTTAAPSGAGPYQIKGSFTVTNDYVIATYMVEHAVALVDMHGFVVRDQEWEIPTDAQVLGYMSVDLSSLSGTYQLDLPIRPEGTLDDVNHDGQIDTGVQVFSVAYWPNLTGGPFSDRDDPSFGWPTYLASVETDTENKDEVIGGKLVVWAPDGQEQFPTGFGPDGLLFTDDDPVGAIPAGYSIVDLDQQPFAVSQEATPELKLYEPKDIAVKDFSGQSYTEAFKSLYDLMSKQWAFNGIPGKEVDWKALYDKLAPRVAEAEQQQDGAAFYQALFDFIYTIPDGHTGLGGGQYAGEAFDTATRAGYGLAIRELDGGQFVVVFVTRDGPADQAGIKVGAQVTAFNGQPIDQALAAVVPLSAPFSQKIFERYQQLRYLFRALEGTSATLTFTSSGEGQPQTVTLKAVAERDSFGFTSVYHGYTAPNLPVDFRVLDSGLGYIRIDTYYDDLNLIIRLFERALKTFQASGVTGLIIDLRYNGGGNPLGLAGFLYDQEIPLGQQMHYSGKSGQFEPVHPPEKIRPFPTQYTFDQLAVLVGPACFSACEAEAYGFSQIPGAIVVGFYSTGGVFADVGAGQVLLPEGMSLQFASDRIVKPDGSLFLEGTGVVPTVKVPLTLDNVTTSEDVVLKAAEDALQGQTPADSSVAPPTSTALTVGSAAEARAALNASTRFLEDLAKEQYDPAELSQAGRTYTYTVGLDRDEKLIWMNGWCASTKETLQDNFKHIQLKFTAAGQPIDLAQLAVLEGPNGDLYCRLYYTVVSNWPAGETTLENAVTFDQKINDGSADYPAGTHTYLYTVTRR